MNFFSFKEEKKLLLWS